MVRTATENDIEKLLEFEQGIVAAERPFDSTLKEGEIHYYDLLELTKSPGSEVVLAIADGEPVGSGYGKIKTADAFLKHSQYVHIGCMYIKPAYRGKGISKMILDALVAWAKQKGITEIRLQVYNENMPAKNAYLKAGFKPNLLEMRMEV